MPTGQALRTQADDDAMKVTLAMFLMACAREKQGLVEAIDAYNLTIPPRPWWKSFTFRSH